MLSRISRDIKRSLIIDSDLSASQWHLPHALELKTMHQFSPQVKIKPWHGTFVAPRRAGRLGMQGCGIPLARIVLQVRSGVRNMGQNKRVLSAVKPIRRFTIRALRVTVFCRISSQKEYVTVHTCTVLRTSASID
jgi:hypothetical protein